MADVATAAYPGVRGRRLSGRLRSLGRAAGRWLSPAKPVLANLAASPLFVSGLACVDAGVFLASTIAGLIVTGGSLILLEHVIADES